jgi:hypothetical protein
MDRRVCEGYLWRRILLENKLLDGTKLRIAS